jgi:hypothetical protein
MKFRALLLIVGLLAGALAIRPSESNASQVCWSRNDALSYSYTGRYEDYTLGGGWWNDNNTHDSGEGPDCSGFSYKSWSLCSTSGNTSVCLHSIGQDTHGPYNAQAFRDGCSGACADVCGSGTGAACGASSYGSTTAMDAFARGPYAGSSYGHIGMIYSESTGGYDNIIEALNSTSGVVLNSRSYRLGAEYDGVTRKVWVTSNCI